MLNIAAPCDAPSGAPEGITSPPFRGGLTGLRAGRVSCRPARSGGGWGAEPPNMLVDYSSILTTCHLSKEHLLRSGSSLLNTIK